MKWRQRASWPAKDEDQAADIVAGRARAEDAAVLPPGDDDDDNGVS